MMIQSRRPVSFISVVLLIFTLSIALVPVQAQSPLGGPGSQVFDFTGAEQQFIIPAGVTSITVQAFGAEGGDSNAGEGGTVQATIPVTPGETLFVYVGGQGGVAPGLGVPATGGFNGGGIGGLAPGSVGGGGGGASDVRQGGNGLNNRVVVAGGGGGHSVLPAGAGGYPDGSSASGGAGGGTQTSGGAGGPGVDGGGAGTAGTLGAGGTGGTGLISGGGGGGGYYGGGGGGGDDDSQNGVVGEGGGGGSGYVISTATNVSSTTGGRPGNGQVIISWGVANVPPIANDDVSCTRINSAVRVSVLRNDIDPDGQALVVQSVTTPAHGTAQIAGAAIIYTPAANFLGDDQFSYTVSDGTLTAAAQVRLSVLPSGTCELNLPLVIQAPLNETQWYRLRNEFIGDTRSLDVTNDGLNTPILAETANVSGQAWRLTLLSNGSYRLTNQFLGVGQALALADDGVNTTLVMRPSAGTSSQSWVLTPLGNGLYRLTNELTGSVRSLDATGNVINPQIAMRDTGNFSNQYWKLSPIAAIGS